MPRLSLLLPLAASFALVACGADEDGNGPDRDTDGRTPTRDSGGRDIPTADVGVEAGGPDTSADAGADVSTDVAPDAQSDVPTTDACDQDNDGHRDIACEGGDDCNDNDRGVSPSAAERCDFVDNNCNGALNDGVDCSFYAHTEDELYEVDPFKGTARYIIDVPGLFDFDTDTDGILWGIAPSALYRLDPLNPDQRDWQRTNSGSWPTVNGFAIDASGRGLATGGNNLYEIDLNTGSSSRVGSFGGFYESSGDCVTDKSDTLYMSSKHREDQDVLVRVDGRTGETTEVGPIGFRGVYGLTSAWGILFGLTSNGELIEIDIATGQGTLLHTFAGKRWYGAASTPDR